MHNKTETAKMDKKNNLYGRKLGHALQGRQARLMQDFLAHQQIDLTNDGGGQDWPQDWPQSWFGKAYQNYALEIGFGGGEHLAARALAQPDIGFIGCEVFINGIAKLLVAIEDNQLSNIRIYGDDARNVLAVLPPASLQAVYLLYPDPWPKNKHHKRRFVQLENLQAIFRVLAEGGTFWVVSDSADYIAWTLGKIYTHGGFAWQAEQATDWRVPPPDWVGTRYENKAQKAGRPSSYLRFIRRPICQPKHL